MEIPEGDHGLWERNDRMHGGCTIYLGMYGSGVRIGIRKRITVRARSWIPLGRNRARFESFVAAVFSTTPETVGMGFAQESLLITSAVTWASGLLGENASEGCCLLVVPGERAQAI